MKQIVKLNEAQLRKVIEESVKMVLKESIYTELPIDTSSLPQPLTKSAIISQYKNDIETLFNSYVNEDNVDTATRYTYGTRLNSGTPLRFVARRRVDKGPMMRAGAVDWRANYGGNNYWELKTTLLKINKVSCSSITFEEVVVAHEGKLTLRFYTKNEMKAYINNLIDVQNAKWEQKKNS